MISYAHGWPSLHQGRDRWPWTGQTLKYFTLNYVNLCCWSLSELIPTQTASCRQSQRPLTVCSVSSCRQCHCVPIMTRHPASSSVMTRRRRSAVCTSLRQGSADGFPSDIITGRRWCSSRRGRRGHRPPMGCCCRANSDWRVFLWRHVHQKQDTWKDNSSDSSFTDTPPCLSEGRMLKTHQHVLLAVA